MADIKQELREWLKVKGNTQTKMAESLEIGQSRISGWKNTDQFVPPELVEPMRRFMRGEPEPAGETEPAGESQPAGEPEPEGEKSVGAGVSCALVCCRVLQGLTVSLCR